jgi:hypothetical protein
MKFTTDANRNGTCLQGYITAYFHQLVEVFGEPELGGDKTTAEWALTFEDGTIATIYDWKEYATPMGEYRWHIGGHSPAAVWAVIDAFEAAKTA